MPRDLSDRQQDNWEPLLAIAHCLGAENYQMAIEAASTICKETAPPESNGNRLLEDIREVLNDYKEPRISSADLVQKLTTHDEMDWDKYFRGDPINQRWLAKTLGQYKIQTKTVRQGSKTPKGYEIRDFDDAFNRYLPPRSDGMADSDPAPEVPPKEPPLAPTFN